MEITRDKLPLLWGFFFQTHTSNAGTGLQTSVATHPDFLEGSVNLFPPQQIIEIGADEELEIVYLSTLLSWAPPGAATFEVYDPHFEIDLADGSQNIIQAFSRRALPIADPGMGQVIPFAANIARSLCFEMDPTRLRGRDIVFPSGTCRFASILFDFGVTNSGALPIVMSAQSTIALRRTQAERY